MSAATPSEHARPIAAAVTAINALAAGRTSVAKRFSYLAASLDTTGELTKFPSLLERAVTELLTGGKISTTGWDRLAAEVPSNVLTTLIQDVRTDGGAAREESGDWVTMATVVETAPETVVQIEEAPVTEVRVDVAPVPVEVAPVPAAVGAGLAHPVAPAVPELEEPVAAEARPEERRGEESSSEAALDSAEVAYATAESAVDRLEARLASLKAGFAA